MTSRPHTIPGGEPAAYRGLSRPWRSASAFLIVPILVALAAMVGACGSAPSPDGPPASMPDEVIDEPVATVAAVPTVSAASTTATTAPPGSPRSSGTASPSVSATVSQPAETAPAEPRPLVTFTVLYDNTGARPGTRTDWGFSCLVTGCEQTVLFDTGKDGDILLSNMEALDVRPEDIDVVVLSHGHSDHTGGLAQIVAHNPAVTVYHPASLSGGVIDRARAAGASLTPVEAPVSIAQRLFITGPLGNPAESALLVETTHGYILVTGCAHPGVVEMVTAAAHLAGEPIHAVLGGFHLMSHSAGQVERIIGELKELGVERCGPAHCTGEAATAQMQTAFGEGFIGTGVGAVITF